MKFVPTKTSLPNPSASQNKPLAQQVTVSITTPATKKKTETPKETETPQKDPAPPTSPILQQPGQFLISASKKTATQANKTPTPVKDVNQRQIPRDILPKPQDESALAKPNEDPPATPTKPPPTPICPNSTPKPTNSAKKTPASRKCVTPMKIAPAKDKAARKKAPKLPQEAPQKVSEQTPAPKDPVAVADAVAQTSVTPEMSTFAREKSTSPSLPFLQISGATQQEPIVIDETDDTSFDDLLEVCLI
jgi:hypothetical protein